MKKVNLYCGLNDKDTKRQQIDTVEAYKIASNICLQLFDGCTIYTADGIYKHENGSMVIEKTLKIELIDAEPEKVELLILELKSIFNQESILKTVEVINFEFC